MASGASRDVRHLLRGLPPSLERQTRALGKAPEQTPAAAAMRGAARPDVACAVRVFAAGENRSGALCQACDSVPVPERVSAFPSSGTGTESHARNWRVPAFPGSRTATESHAHDRRVSATSRAGGTIAPHERIQGHPRRSGRTKTATPSGEKYQTSQGFTAIRDGIKAAASASAPVACRWAASPAGCGHRCRRGAGFEAVKQTVREHRLATVCEEAHCPNIGECWSRGTATFMLLGEICTRGCRFCAVTRASRRPSTREPTPPAPWPRWPRATSW